MSGAKSADRSAEYGHSMIRTVIWRPIDLSHSAQAQALAQETLNLIDNGAVLELASTT